LNLPPPDAILSNISKAFEECNLGKLFHNRHNTNNIQNKILTHNLTAFTLAEVLITLVVIGVIAAITVPTLIQNYKKQEASARIKKFYSTMQQVVTKAKADGNDWEDGVEIAGNSEEDIKEIHKNFADKYILPYMIYEKIVNLGSNFYVYLNDGSYFYLPNVSNRNCMHFVVDINGEKKPNELGRDKFNFHYCTASDTQYMEQSKFTPYRDKNMDTREQTHKWCEVYGAWCTALLAIDNWEFKSDYPYKI
jgi:prepilin-type N-terminal cleavage/methylation domain-containing protein